MACVDNKCVYVDGNQGMMSVILTMTAVAADAFLCGFMGVGATVLTDICIGMRQM